MTIYIVILAVIGVFAALVSAIPKSAVFRARLQSALAMVVGLILIIVLALRDHNVGVDVKQYLLYWEAADIYELSEISRFEPAFLGLIEWSRLFSDSPQFFLAVAAVLALAPVSFTIRKVSPLPLMSWFIYICLGFYAFTFSGLRQSIAYGLTFFAIYLIRRKRPLVFVLAILVASTFHVSALVFLPAYIVYWVRLGRLGLVIYSILALALFVFRETIYLWVTTYIYPDYDLAPSSSYNWLALSAGIVVVLWLLLGAKSKDEIRHTKPQDETGLLQLTTVGVTLMLFASVGTNVMRMADYYYMAVVLALPAVLNLLSSKHRDLMRLGTIVVLSIVFVSQMISSPYSIVPYELYAD